MVIKMKVFEELEQRGFLAQCTDFDRVRNALDNEKVTFYIGFDPTADSLTAGHFLTLMAMAHLQRAGHRPIILLGGGTVMVGDPSGRSDMRKMLDRETIDYNTECFKKQMSKFIDFSDGKAIIANNADWLLNLNYIEFLRDVGVHFTVNRMLAAECFKSRYERGLTFIEFNYMLMQSYDFYVLMEKYGCSLEFGGDDQWSNMLGGTELIRRKMGKDADCLTFKLLTTSDGKKMGKTQKGAVWLDPKKTTPYEFYQYWRNIEDSKVIECLKLLTFLPLEEIDRLAKLEGSGLNKAKEVLAYELTSLVHSREEADKAQEVARALFSGGAEADVPSCELTVTDFADGKISILDLLLKTKQAPSKGEARRLIDQGGVFIGDDKVTSITEAYSPENINGKLVKKGKKSFIKIIVKD